MSSAMSPTGAIISLGIGIGIGLSFSSSFSFSSLTSYTYHDLISLFTIRTLLSIITSATSLTTYLYHHPYTYYVLYTFLSIYVVHWYYRIFWRPLEYTRSLPQQQKDTVGRRVYNNYPSPYPNGWYKLFESWQVPLGESRSISAFGCELVVFRQLGDKDGNGRGKIAILDAICPHLGAHLGVGGKVVGNCIECPFHAWQFDGEGTCQVIPYAAKVPEVAKTYSWHCAEVNQMIFVYHDIDRTGNKPIWDIPDLVSDPKEWIYHGRTEHEMTCHLQEIPENGPDTAHLNVVHKSFVIDWISGDNGATHLWNASWVPRNEPETHIADIKVVTRVNFRGWIVPGTTVEAIILQVGLSNVFLRFPTPFGDIMVIENLLPIQSNTQRAHNIVFAEKYVPRGLAKMFLYSLTTQFEKDIPIWDNKRFLRKPMPVKEDGPILKFRRWCNQFYSEKGTKMPQGFDW